MINIHSTISKKPWAVPLFFFAAFSTLLACASGGVQQAAKKKPASEELGASRMNMVMNEGLMSSSCTYFNKELKCWGYNRNGSLGRGRNEHYGDSSGENYANLTAIDLGQDVELSFRTGKSKLNYSSHNCVVYNSPNTTNGVKCWGQNDKGQLGHGNRQNRGNNQQDMGDNLPKIELGSGVEAKQVATGAKHTCVLTTQGRVKCWGKYSLGVLGGGQDEDIGDQQNEMGDNLPYVELGEDSDTGEPIAWEALVSGSDFSCVVSYNKKIKCWGYNWNGQLGYGDQINRGIDPDSMGNNLNFVSLGHTEEGEGEKVKQITTGYDHICVLTQSNKVKCWGKNDKGQLGLGHSRHIGDQMNEMGGYLEHVDFGTEEEIRILRSFGMHACVLFVSGRLKCWGENRSAQLGLGHSRNIGDGSGEMGNNLPYVDLGTGMLVLDFWPNHSTTCALLTLGKMKCWGRGTNGALLNQTRTKVGDQQDEMGDYLLPLEGLEISTEELIDLGYLFP